jgi:hypothetical protein
VSFGFSTIERISLANFRSGPKKTSCCRIESGDHADTSLAVTTEFQPVSMRIIRDHLGFGRWVSEAPRSLISAFSLRVFAALRFNRVPQDHRRLPIGQTPSHPFTGVTPSPSQLREPARAELRPILKAAFLQTKREAMSAVRIHMHFRRHAVADQSTIE